MSKFNSQSCRFQEPSLLQKHMDSFNILEVSAFIAAAESARYFQRKMGNCVAANDDLQLLELAVSWRRMKGLVMEFGVASGRTINYLAARMPQETIFGFDWFKGLPEPWRTGFDRGAFAHAPPQVLHNVELVSGLFQDTLGKFLMTHQEPASLLHIDCDLYESTHVVLSALAERIVPGTVIVFDEYVNYPGWKQHEFRAFQEFVKAGSRHYEYLGFVPKHQQVCVRMLPSDGSSPR